jgi:hypothetical protein
MFLRSEKQIQPVQGIAAVKYKHGVFCLDFSTQRKLPSSYKTDKQIPLPLVRKRTIPTERLPLVGEVSANFCR